MEYDILKYLPIDKKLFKDFLLANEHLVIGGSLSLMYWGCIPYRKASDIDFIKIGEGNITKIIKQEERKIYEIFGLDDETENIEIHKLENTYPYAKDEETKKRKNIKLEGIRCCVFNNVNEKYITYYSPSDPSYPIKIAYPENIINAKLQYITKPWFAEKHTKDIRTYYKSSYYRFIYRRNQNHHLINECELELQ